MVHIGGEFRRASLPAAFLETSILADMQSYEKTGAFLIGHLRTEKGQSTFDQPLVFQITA